MVQEPNVEDTISILRGLKDRYESHHGVRILDESLIAAATLSDRYINDRFLPDKAIDLVDEAASRLRMEIDSMPVEIDEATRQLTRMQIEAAGARKRSQRRQSRASAGTASADCGARGNHQPAESSLGSRKISTLRNQAAEGKYRTSANLLPAGLLPRPADAQKRRLR